MTARLCACLSGCFNGAEGVIETVVVQEGGGLMVGWERRGEGVKRGGRGGFIHSFSHPVCDSLEVSHLAALAFVCLLASTRFPRESVLLKSSCTRLTVGHHSSQNQSLEGRVHDSWFQVHRNKPYSTSGGLLLVPMLRAQLVIYLYMYCFSKVCLMDKLCCV